MPELPTPIVLKDGPYTATATHDHFGLRAQRWVDGPLDIHRMLGIQNADGTFTALNGVSEDGAHQSPSHAQGTLAEMDAWLAIPEVQVALGKLSELYVHIKAARSEETRPAWLPTPAA